jgi:uncharacterized protein YigE (DUF2233 family)
MAKQIYKSRVNSAIQGGPASTIASLALCFITANTLLADNAPCTSITNENQRYAVCNIDLSRYQIQLFWLDKTGQPFGSLGRFARAVDTPQQPLIIAMNAGMYHSDLSPVGLYVEHGQQLVRVNTAGGPGNFHMKPNGIFFVSDGTVGVMETSRFLRERPAVNFATQSGPMLVIDGHIHPRFSRQGQSRKIRNGVGVRDRNTVLLAVSDTEVSFSEFARLFRDRLGCPNALYFDGSISSLYAPSVDRRDSFWPVGPIVGIFQRSKQ